jgi:hypothetical protein
MRGKTPVEALVQVGDVETRYVCAGQGPPVVLLTDEDPALSVDTPLFRALSASYRVVSTAPGEDPRTGPWLRAMIDALGWDRPTLVVASRTSAAWVELILAEAKQCCSDDLGEIVRADPFAPFQPGTSGGD